MKLDTCVQAHFHCPAKGELCSIVYVIHGYVPTSNTCMYRLYACLHVHVRVLGSRGDSVAKWHVHDDHVERKLHTFNVVCLDRLQLGTGFPVTAAFSSVRSESSPDM